MARTMGVPESLRRCLARPGFVERLLALLAERASESAKHGAVEAAVARMTMRRCLTTLVLVVAGVARADDLHARFRECGAWGALALAPDTHTLWSDCVLNAVREFDPGLTDTLEADWRATLDAGARLLGARPGTPGGGVALPG
jgi:hypothetical protein